MAKLTKIRICRALFKMRFQEDLFMTEDEYLALKSLYRSMKRLDLYPSCGWAEVLRFSYIPTPAFLEKAKRNAPK